MARFLKLLRSPGLALGVLSFLALYGGAAAWLPLASRGAADGSPLMRALGLDHPFTAAPFLVACALLFINTLACTWDRTNRVTSLWRGIVPPAGVALEGGTADAQRSFLRERGFRGKGHSYFRFRWALWGGWLLHVGLLLLMAAILLQQGFHEGGTFELAEGERLALEQEGAVHGRESGLFAPKSPPHLEVGLFRYDASLHQRGFSPDRGSGLLLQMPGRAPLEATVDRSSGVSYYGLAVFQAIPTGLSLTIAGDGLGTRSIHLHGDGHIATAQVTDPMGVPTTFVLEAERDLSDRLGTGALRVRVERAGVAIPIEPGRGFPFGRREATLVGVSRWSAFTYSRSPGMPWVFAAFGVILGASLVMLFPAGVARYDEGSEAFRVYVVRGGDALLSEWARWNARGAKA